MMLNRIVTLSLAVGFLLSGGAIYAQQQSPSTAAPVEVKLSEALLNRLPPDLREKAGALLTMVLWSGAASAGLADSTPPTPRKAAVTSANDRRVVAGRFSTGSSGGVTENEVAGPADRTRGAGVADRGRTAG